MKKMLSLFLALAMLFGIALAETPDVGVIGGADGPTSIFVAADAVTRQSMVDDAIAAGRRVTMDVSFTEVAGIDLGDPTVNAAIADLINAFGVSANMQGNEMDAALSLSGKDVLTFGWVASGDDAYIKSNLIGGTVVLSAVEIEPLLGRLIDMLVVMEAYTEEEAASMKEEIGALIEQVKMALEQSGGMTFTEEDLMALDFTALETVFAALAEDVEEVQDIVVPRMCDPAVAGARLSIDNDELISVLKAFLQFIKDNPKLMDYIAAQGDFPTEESIAQEWTMYGDMYKKFGIYESEEAYRAELTTFPELLEQASEMLDTTKALDGEFVTTVYVNEADEVVYLTATMPLFIADETLYEQDAAAEVTGTTQNVNVTYTRQTVAEGVSHVCNIDMDGDVLTIDVLEKENAMDIVVSAKVVTPNDYSELQTLLTINIVNEDGTVKGSFAINEEAEEKVTGSFAFSHAADDTKFATDFDFDMDIQTVEPIVDSQNVDENGVAVIEWETVVAVIEWETVTRHFGLAYTCDYDRNGVDFAGSEIIAIVFDDMKLAVKADTATTDPVPSIMAGDVVRPMELDDAAFANWFVGAYNSLSSWLANVLTALPESVLTLLISTGMMDV